MSAHRHLHPVADPAPVRPSADFETWLVYEDEKAAIREEAAIHAERLAQLRRRWRAIEAAQRDLRKQEAA